MKKVSKLLALVLSLCLVIGAMTACGSKGNEEETTSATTKAAQQDSSESTTAAAEEETTQAADASEPVTVDIFQFKVEFKDQFESAAVKYMESHPNVTLNIATVGGGDDYGAALKAKFAAGKDAEPTVFNIGGPQDVKDWETRLAEVTDTQAAKNAAAGILDGVTIDGKIYGLPYNVEGYGYVYNKKIFADAGIDVATITDWASFVAAVETLDSKKAELGLDAVFALAAKEDWTTGLHMANSFVSAEFGSDLNTFNAKTLEFKFAEQFKQQVDLLNKYSVQPTVSLDYSTQVEQLFSMGKVAIIHQGNWVAGSIKGIDEELAANVGLLPISIDGFKNNVTPVGAPMYWALNNGKSEAELKAAKDFLDWLYTSDEGKDIVLSDFGFIPAYTGYDTSKISDPISLDICKAVDAGTTINWVFMGFPTNWGQGVLGQDIMKYCAGEIEWDALVTNAKTAWENARK